jgi:catechol 2,3-dioxygenase
VKWIAIGDNPETDGAPGTARTIKTGLSGGHPMQVPQTDYKSPFRFSRASHSVFTSRDLKKSEEFYTEVLGLVVSDSDKDTLYLRGLEERSHHSLVIKRTTDAPMYERAGLRVFDEEDLELCKHAFERHQLPCKWVEQPFQNRTLHATDICGTPLEICATMDRKPRLDMDVHKHKGAQARRFDHYQITIPDIEKATRFYASLGCRVADYITAGGHPIGVFLQMKDTPYDLVFLERDGPAYHHFGYVIPDLQAMLRACDTMGELGWGKNVEYGPGKHGVGHSYYVYILDPDGHRSELLLPPIVYMDSDDPPHVWDVVTTERATEAWGLPPRETWFSHRSAFKGVTVTAPPAGGSPLTLEKYLQIAE